MSLPPSSLLASAPASLTDVSAEWPGWREVAETLTLRAGFNTSVVIVGTTLLGLAAGVVGTFVLLRRRALVADAIGHATLPGIALAYLLAPALGFAARSLPVLLVGAAGTAILAVLAIGGILRHRRLH